MPTCFLHGAKSGFLLEGGSRVPAPVYFEQSTQLLKCEIKKKKKEKYYQP